MVSVSFDGLLRVLENIKESEAIRAGDIVGARLSSTYADWTSQRVFGFSTDRAKRIETALKSKDVPVEAG